MKPANIAALTLALATRLSLAAPPNPLLVSSPGAPLAGSLFYATCNLPQCDTLALALFQLANKKK